MESWRSLYPFDSQYFAICTDGSQVSDAAESDGTAPANTAPANTVPASIVPASTAPASTVRMHYIDEGQGRPLLMLHGNPTWSFYYRDLITSFRSDYRCLAVDHVGCGLSDKPRDYPYHLARRIDDVVAFIESQDLRDITLIAHDWGGAIGMGTIKRVPDRFAQAVLFNTAAFPPPKIPFRIQLCRLPLLGTLGVRGLNLFAVAALWMAVEDRANLPPLVRQGLVAPYDQWSNRRAIDCFVKDIPTPGAPTWELLEAIEASLAQLTIPVKLMWGMKDWCFDPSCLRRLQQSIPDASVTEFSRAGHYVVEEETDAIVRELSAFLALA